MSHLIGVHPEMPSAEYHAISDAIGSSSLMAMDQSPRHFHHAWTTPGESTPARTKGTMLHSLLLEQDIGHYIPRPLNEKGDLVRSNSKEYAEFLAANPGKTPIHPDDYEPMYQMLTAFCENKRAMDMMNGARIENSVFAKDPETGLLLKARPDIWGTGYMADLKSTSNIRGFERQIFREMYDVRLAHYAKVIEYTTGEMIEEFFFISYESGAPYCSKIFLMRKSDMEAAKAKWRTLINQVSVCIKNRAWPGFEDSIHLVVRPKFLEEETITFEEVG